VRGLNAINSRDELRGLDVTPSCCRSIRRPTRCDSYGHDCQWVVSLRARELVSARFDEPA
jgi:hypothetical protein